MFCLVQSLVFGFPQLKGKTISSITHSGLYSEKLIDKRLLKKILQSSYISGMKHIFYTYSCLALMDVMKSQHVQEEPTFPGTKNHRGVHRKTNKKII